MRPILNDALRTTEFLKSGEGSLQMGQPCRKIGRVTKGVLRAYVVSSEGEEITTHIYREGDMIIGSFILNASIGMSIEALTDCEISVADYAEVMSTVNKHARITDIINVEFDKLNKQLKKRLVSLLKLTSLKKYKLPVADYPQG